MAKFNPGDRVRFQSMPGFVGTVVADDDPDVVFWTKMWSSVPTGILWVKWDHESNGPKWAPINDHVLVEDPFDTWVKRVREGKDAEV